MANPLHLEVNCSGAGTPVTQRPLSDQEWSDHQALQTAVTTQLQAETTAQATRLTQLKALLTLHPELQPLMDFLRIKLT